MLLLSIFLTGLGAALGRVGAPDDLTDSDCSGSGLAMSTSGSTFAASVAIFLLMTSFLLVVTACKIANEYLVYYF